jgi:hypothetical protein
LEIVFASNRPGPHAVIPARSVSRGIKTRSCNSHDAVLVKLSKVGLRDEINFEVQLRFLKKQNEVHVRWVTSWELVELKSFGAWSLRIFTSVA